MNLVCAAAADRADAFAGSATITAQAFESSPKRITTMPGQLDLVRHA